MTILKHAACVCHCVLPAVQGQSSVQLPCPGPEQSQRPRCTRNSTIRETSWISDLRVRRRDPPYTTVRLEWDLDAMLPDVARYSFVWRRVEAPGMMAEFAMRRQSAQVCEIKLFHKLLSHLYRLLISVIMLPLVLHYSLQIMQVY